MVKQYPYYSTNNIDFEIYQYKCIIAKALVVDKEAIIENDLIINIFELKGLRYFVFSSNKFIYLN